MFPGAADSLFPINFQGGSLVQQYTILASAYLFLHREASRSEEDSERLQASRAEHSVNSDKLYEVRKVHIIDWPLLFAAAVLPASYWQSYLSAATDVSKDPSLHPA